MMRFAVIILGASALLAPPTAAQDAEPAPPDVRPLSRQQPEYPLVAAYSGYAGLCLVDFDIDRYGRPENVCVACTSSVQPGEESAETVAEIERTFALASAEAVTYWRYEGSGLPVQGVEARFDYEIAAGGDQAPDRLPDDIQRFCATPRN